MILTHIKQVSKIDNKRFKFEFNFESSWISQEWGGAMDYNELIKFTFKIA